MLESTELLHSPDLPFEQSMDSVSPTSFLSRTQASVAHVYNDPIHRHAMSATYPLGVDDSPTSSESAADDARMDQNKTAKETMAKLLDGKEEEWTAVAQKPGPLQLLDLPIDVLKEIIKEVTHTNDLAALALTHSALHRLAIPHIYSRFDIVWPDSETHSEPRSGVDALTYGLATLVMAEDVFREATYTCSHCGVPNQPSTSKYSSIAQKHPHVKKRRRGNHYAEYTRKFSLGNGPPDWVKEYMITKEAGKMLGTLVALAVARMKNLESFVWDMPTGVLRDVWLALSSLEEREDGHDCRLEKIWIRWHNNAEAMQGLNSPVTASAPPPLFGNSAPLAHNGLVQPITPQAPLPAASDSNRVEHPTFSVLPPLKSLTVLDIDELEYLDEMSVLIGKSQNTLRELRVGIASHVASQDWVAAWQGDGADYWDIAGNLTSASSNGDRRTGGIIGTLVSQCFDEAEYETNEQLEAEVAKLSLQPSLAPPQKPRDAQATSFVHVLKSDDPQSDISAPTFGRPATTDSSKEPAQITESTYSDANTKATDTLSTFHDTRTLKDGKRLPKKVFRTLQLQVLELERVPLSVRVLGNAIDWTSLTHLTLLGCQNYEKLWRTLRKTFAPTPLASSTTSPSKTRPNEPPAVQYRLNLRKIQTDQVTGPLITFLKETLAPNTLEVLFLQNSGMNLSSVTIHSIYRGPIRRHRASLQKILIDSSEKDSDNTKWAYWMLPREVVGFITSGKMSNLRELGVAIEYRDWHFFLQRLPAIPHIRSLYIPYIGNHAHGTDLDPRELAMQVVDIVTLCPEIQLCYIGLLSKCFELLEGKAGDHDLRLSDFDAGLQHLGHLGHNMTDDDDDDDDAGDEDDGEDDEDGEAAEGDASEDEDAETDEEAGRDSDDDSGSETEATLKVPLRLREILYYDDKVAVFKARHGKL